MVTITDNIKGMAPRQRATRQGAVVRDALRKAGGFRSAQDVYAVLRGADESVGLSTVYRHLQALVNEGVVDVIHTEDGEATYRFCGETGDRHHHHLVCRTCGRTEEIEGRAVERWAGEVAERHGYAEVDHTVELFGVCPSCSRGR
jgi:Fur family ferric uptake transcriptional regulator